MKYAMTADGKIATKTGASKWVTGEAARAEVQNMRHQYMGIMVGIGTVLEDDPMLNVRFPGGNSPVRIICDSRLRIPLDSNIVETAHDYRTIVACGEEAAAKTKKEKLEAAGVEVFPCPDTEGQIDLQALMQYLGEQKIDSVLIEGGGTLNDSALRSGIVQEIKVFIAPKIFGGQGSISPVEGVGVAFPKEAVRLNYQGMTQIGEDLMLSYKIGRQDECLQES
jgi:diaminohydroxyphosphoribosylaminopyrimidine deaminase/5-amino-6-(5-phosphoribosylamino)uracil reductase